MVKNNVMSGQNVHKLCLFQKGYLQDLSGWNKTKLRIHKKHTVHMKSTGAFHEKHIFHMKSTGAFHEKHRFSKDHLQGIVTLCFLSCSGGRAPTQE